MNWKYVFGLVKVMGIIFWVWGFLLGIWVESGVGGFLEGIWGFFLGIVRGGIVRWYE